MLEKKYLEVKLNGQMFGAFEGVTDLNAEGNHLNFTSSEGTFSYTKNENGLWTEDEGMGPDFDDYNLCGARALSRHQGGRKIRDMADMRQNDLAYVKNTMDAQNDEDESDYDESEDYDDYDESDDYEDED